MKIGPAIRRRHELEQRHPTGRLEENSCQKRKEKTKKKKTQITKAQIGLREKQPLPDLLGETKSL
jgi:hypothetical protein